MPRLMTRKAITVSQVGEVEGELAKRGARGLGSHHKIGADPTKVVINKLVGN